MELVEKVTDIINIRADDIKRVRINCPYCRIMCYGNRHDYYDGSYFFLDCGTKIDSEGWTPPPKKKCRYCRKHFEPQDMREHLMEYHKMSPSGVEEKE